METSPPTRRQLLGQAAARSVAAPDPVPFNPDEFAMVGVYGLDWLLDPRFTRMLDIIAASPGAIRSVRVFGALSLGRDKVAPMTSAGVWDGPGPPDFSRTLEALSALTSRGLVPFLPLTFFPPRVSPKPSQPPADWDNWSTLVREFLQAVVVRFGAAEVGRWWFEVWNEPNMPPFWGGDFDRYLDLYRATAAAVAQTGHAMRLGGPVLAYLPGPEAPALMERFLRFLADQPGLRCNFLSLHRKGAWTNEEGEPDLRRLQQAAVDTAEAVLRIVPGRARGMVIVNNEADMLVGFDRPYQPRMTHQSVAWLAAVAAMHDRLNQAYARQGIRFRAASDNANQHLTQGPFDGRRTLMTPLSDRMDDLVKLPVYSFYELLRVMGPRRVTDAAAARAVPPGVSYLCTEGPAGMAALFSQYGTGQQRFSYRMPGPDSPVNVVQFVVDADRTGARPGLDPPAMRRAAELAVAAPIRHEVRLGAEPIALGPYGTALLWVTPFRPAPLPTPQWLQARPDGSNTLLRWTPTTAPHFWSYEVRRNGAVITPTPLRASFWIDDAAGYAAAGRRHYEVRSISVSGNASSWATALVNF